MSNNPVNGINYFFKGFSLIFKPGIRPWVVIPLLINILLFSALIYYAWQQFPIVIETIVAQIESELPDWEWLVSLVRWLMWPLFIVLAPITVFFTFTFVGNLIGSPFNGLLAKAVEKHLTGKTIQSPPESLFGFILGIFWAPIEKLLYYLWLAFLILIVSLIPVINIISPLLWFLFGAWLVSLEYADAPLGNHGYNARAIRKILAQKRTLTLGFGSTVLMVMLIPFVNFFVMPAAVAGTTYMWIHEFADSAPPTLTLP